MEPSEFSDPVPQMVQKSGRRLVSWYGGQHHGVPKSVFVEKRRTVGQGTGIRKVAHVRTAEGGAVEKLGQERHGSHITIVWPHAVHRNSHHGRVGKRFR